MIDIISITLENEMDLVLAHKRSMKIADKIGLTIATQTSFATAVSEVARIVIEHTNLGVLQLGIIGSYPKYNLSAVIVFESTVELSRNHEGFFYAQKLVPEFKFTTTDGSCVIEMSVGLPRSLKFDKLKIAQLHQNFKDEAPINAYEEIKNKNNFLNKMTVEQEAAILQEKLINEKRNEFISTASHEIKTPITILKAYTQILRKLQDQCPPNVNSIIEKLDVQTTKLSNLVQQLMDVSQIENGSIVYSMEEFSFNEFLTDVVSVLGYVHVKHQINLDLVADYKISADKLRLEQVFTNLLGNAAKYSAANTNITISCEASQGQLTIAITDEGQGMDGNVLESIFEKFYRNTEVVTTHPGLGMGLYITSKIVVDHGGKIWAESERNKGSVFFISLPHL